MLKLAQTVCCTLTLFGFQGPTGFTRDPMVSGANLSYTTAGPALSTLFCADFFFRTPHARPRGSP